MLWHTLELIYTKKYPRVMYQYFNDLSSRFHLCCKPTVHVNILLFTCSTWTLSLSLAEVKIAERCKATLIPWKPASYCSNYYWKNQLHMIHRYDSHIPHSVNWRNNWKPARIKLSLTPALKESFSNTHGSIYYTIYSRIKSNSNTLENAGML